MGIISKIKRVLKMLFEGRAKERFDVKPITNDELNGFLSVCKQIYEGYPYWLDDEAGIKTVNFAAAVAEETARLTTLGLGIQIDGDNARSEWLQKRIDSVYYKMRDWVGYADGYGCVILKPNGEDIDVYTPEEFCITEVKGDVVRGAIFVSKRSSSDRKKFYTRLEYHHFAENDDYIVENAVYEGETENDLDREIGIELSPWSDLEEEVTIEGLEKPLFALLRTPVTNNICKDSPLGIPVYSKAIEELRDLDVAYSRNAVEVEDSQRITLVDSDMLVSESGKAVTRGIHSWKRAAEKMRLPRFVRNVDNSGANTYYQDINPELRTSERLVGINALLSQIGYKCGFSNGYFVFDQKNGFSTATQVEADQQRTIQYIKDCRDKLESCIKDLVYALDKFADLYDLAPVGETDIVFDFGDITYNYEEDRNRWYGYVMQGRVPFSYYLQKFEGMTEDEAKELEEQVKAEQAEAMQGQLFGAMNPMGD